jgi:L-threonylcarbamoyladenylate synthase
VTERLPIRSIARVSTPVSDYSAIHVPASLIAEAAELIRSGRLVAFPTETVYGLGANALDPIAVQRIFDAKGRPSSSPLIVHVDSVDMARTLVTEWPDSAAKLAARHWPGPLTLVLPKAAHVPDAVTAGLPTVGIRMPAHPVALALIRAAGLPIAAPSANRFTELSPTSADHVRAGLGDRVDMILDRGSTPVGIESTVISLASDPPILFRPGMISRDEIESLIGPVSLPNEPLAGAHSAPGLHPRHYSPRTRLVLVRDGVLPRRGRGIYLSHLPGGGQPMPGRAKEYAAILYSTLHKLDQQRLDWIAVEMPPDTEEWAGVRDRLQRASGI